MNEEKHIPNGGADRGSSSVAPTSALSLDDLVALNAEIAALVRAGVPLEQGLAELGPDLPGRLGRYATVLAQRTAQGESLAQAIANDSAQLPPAYRAVIAAGVRAGRLPAALESVAASASRLAESRRSMLIDAAYPLLIVLVAWCGLLFFACVLAPRLAEMFAAFGVPGREFLEGLARAGRTAMYWGPILPAILAILAVRCWRVGGRAAVYGEGRGPWLTDWMPWVGQIMRYSRTATFLDVLALLVENQTPLGEGLVLAADASGDPEMVRSAGRLAAALESGQTQFTPNEMAFPPLVNWLLSSIGRDEALLPAIRHAAATCRRRARDKSDLLRVFAPVLLTLLIGGSAVVLYSLMLFLPYVSLLNALGK